MRNTQLEQSRTSSLRDTIFSTICNTKLQAVSNLIRHTRSRGSSNQPSDIKPSAQSLSIQPDLSPHRLAFSPPSLNSRNKAHRSTDNIRPPPTTYLLARPLKQKISKGYEKQIFLLEDTSKRGEQKKKKTGSRSKGKNQNKSKKEESRSSYSKSKNSKSLDRGSKLNLSSIVEQESCQSKLKTPSQKKDLRNKRKFSGQATKKKERKNFRDVVWKRLDKSLKEPEKYQKILKNDYFTIKFRILRKKLLQIQININKCILNLNISLHKGNLECQGIEETFRKLELSKNFSLYTSVRAVDLNQPFRLPQLQIQALLEQQERFEKVITIPFCWIHMTEESQRSVQRSRIKTKVCIEQMGCSKATLRSFMGVFPGWKCQPMSRGIWVWESRMDVGMNEFEFRVVEHEGRCGGQLSGRGEERLTLMMQFIEELMK